MIDLPNNLISAIGMLNGKKRNWAIEYNPRDNYYIARVGSRNVIKKDHIDDLLIAMIEVADTPDSEKHMIGFSDE